MDAGSNLVKAMEFLRVIKMCSTPSFRWEVKQKAPCHKILCMLKNLV
jgi:hypothetical protein